MMGTGKTTIGRALSRRMIRVFFDSDQQVEDITGRTVAEIWKAEGEQAFRALESRALASALSWPAPSVVAAAGGVVLDAANRALISERSRVVWLRARSETLAARVGDGAGRPLLDDSGGIQDRLGRLAEEREPLYAGLAGLTVDVDDLARDQVVERIASWVP